MTGKVQFSFMGGGYKNYKDVFLIIHSAVPCFMLSLIKSKLKKKKKQP